jgi:hypothetical protein
MHRSIAELLLLLQLHMHAMMATMSQLVYALERRVYGSTANRVVSHEERMHDGRLPWARVSAELNNILSYIAIASSLLASMVISLAGWQLLSIMIAALQIIAT